jgi:NAD(P)H-nitrite reductase large subunit
MSTNYLIIGTGPAGIAAGEAIRSYDKTGNVLMIAEESHGYYSRPGLAYLITGEMHESGLYPFSASELHKKKFNIINAKVSNIIPDQKAVKLSNGKKIAYDQLLIASGASAVTLQMPGADLKGVVKLDTLMDAREIIKLARRAKSAVVVGGGITALEIVEGLISRGVKTHYFLRRDRYWSNVLDEKESLIVQHKLREEGVQIHFHTDLDEIIGKKGKLTSVKTKDGKLIKCNILAIAIGIRPRIDLVADTDIKTDRGIMVDDQLKSNFNNIYSAGDVAQVYDPVVGKSVLDSLWGPAREQGYIAGLNMVGKQTIYRRSIPFNVTRLAGLTTTIIGTVGKGVDKDITGIARGDSETWRQLPDAISSQSNFDVNRLRLLIYENLIIGAIVMGDQKLSKFIHCIVKDQMDISSISSSLLKEDAALPDLILDYWQKRRH